jgi:hypothetical protein
MSEPEFPPWLVEQFSGMAREAMAEGRLAMFALYGNIPEFGRVRGLCERRASGIVMRGTQTTPSDQEPFAEDMTWETFSRTVQVGSTIDRLIHLDLDWASSFMTMEIGPLDAGHLRGWIEAMKANGVQIVSPDG